MRIPPLETPPAPSRGGDHIGESTDMIPALSHLAFLEVA